MTTSASVSRIRPGTGSITALWTMRRDARRYWRWRARSPPLPEKAPSLPVVSIRCGRGAWDARVDVLRDTPDLPAGENRGRYQLRRRLHVWPHARHHARERGEASIDQVAEAVAKWQGRVVRPDQFPDRGHYYRSDQFSFAKIGVPALYFDDGTDFIGRPPEWGRQQIEAGRRSGITSRATSWMTPGTSTAWVEDAAVGVLFRLAHRTGRCDADLESRGMSSRRRAKKALAAVGLAGR